MPALLAPASLAWNAVVRLRGFFTRSYQSGLPVLCIGNFTAGGAGKTPAAMAVAHILQNAGERPLFLTRGYGGNTKGPLLIDPEHHTARTVGDEPLLLAQTAPTLVCADRAAGAKLAEHQDAGVIIMDDGLLNPGLAKNLNLVVVDGVLGLGNEHVIPSGPLRASLGHQMAQAHALILVGEGVAAGRVRILAKQAALPVFSASLDAMGDTSWLQDKPLVAFAGIGNPDKFFRTLTALDGKITAQIPFPDHHPYTTEDAQKLLELAAQHNAQLVTTEKDMMRIEGQQQLQDLKRTARALPVRMEFKDKQAVHNLLLQAVSQR